MALYSYFSMLFLAERCQFKLIVEMETYRLAAIA